MKGRGFGRPSRSTRDRLNMLSETVQHVSMTFLVQFSGPKFLMRKSMRKKGSLTYHFTVRPESGECSAEAIPMFDVDTIAVRTP